jgi:hypothetical protein
VLAFCKAHRYAVLTSTTCGVNAALPAALAARFRCCVELACHTWRTVGGAVVQVVDLRQPTGAASISLFGPAHGRAISPPTFAAISPPGRRRYLAT